MTATTIIILVLAYGIGGAVCLMLGLVIGAAARRPEQRELHEMDMEQPPKWNRRPRSQGWEV